MNFFNIMMLRGCWDLKGYWTIHVKLSHASFWVWRQETSSPAEGTETGERAAGPKSYKCLHSRSREENKVKKTVRRNVGKEHAMPK